MKTCATLVLVLLMCHNLVAEEDGLSVASNIVIVSTTLMAPTDKGVAKLNELKALAPDEWKKLEEFWYTKHLVQHLAMLDVLKKTAGQLSEADRNMEKAEGYRHGPRNSAGPYNRVQSNILKVFVFDNYKAIIETIDNRIAAAKSAPSTKSPAK